MFIVLTNKQNMTHLLLKNAFNANFQNAIRYDIKKQQCIVVYILIFLFIKRKKKHNKFIF